LLFAHLWYAFLASLVLGSIWISTPSNEGLASCSVPHLFVLPSSCFHPNRQRAIITPEEEGYAPFKVDSDYMLKHKPEVGGYYVVYKDGYKSYSPAKVFEEGYTLIK